MSILKNSKCRLFFTYHNKLINQSFIILNKYFSISGKCKNTQIKNENNKLSMFAYLQKKIRACGPITVAEYMKEALTNVTGGYYMNKDVFGREGDFVTSPEISQLFGEMIGVWILNEWRKITKDNFQLVELGPGRGSLARDILKVLKQFKAIDKLSLHLVEVSPTLSDIQAKRLCTSSELTNVVTNSNDKYQSTENSKSYYREGITEDGVKVFWYYSVQDVPKTFSVFLAHEFFDALPIHKYQKHNGAWHEVFIDIDSVNENKLRYVLSSFPTLTSQLFTSDDESRDHIEVSPESLIIIDYLANFLHQHGGFSLIIDYGHIGDKTDTFRAFKNHKQHDPLINPGLVDLTADVDFNMLKKIAEKDGRTLSFGPVSQREFLMQLGINVRYNMLLKKMNEKQTSQLTNEYEMLTNTDKMGECFKVMSVFPSVLKEYLLMWPVVGFYEDKKNKL